MTFICRWILLCLWMVSFAGVAKILAAPASMVAGAIKAANVRGDVKKINLVDQSEKRLVNGETLVQENAIVTGPGNSSAVLVFANGSTVRVGNESRLEIREFLMAPLQADIANVAALTAEPTVSRTDLRLEFGEVVGNVKTLNHAAGSTFSVSTPAGAAGIRGTTFRIVYRPSGNGRAFNYHLSTSEGIVRWQPPGTAGVAGVNVPLGQEIAGVAQIDPVTNAVVTNTGAGGPGAPLAARQISSDASAALQAATVQIVETQQQTKITQLDMQTAGEQLKLQKEKPVPKPPAEPPPPPNMVPRITTPDGRP